MSVKSIKKVAGPSQYRRGSTVSKAGSLPDFAKVADRMDGIDARANCPYKAEKGSKKFEPPYSLVERLNGVSRRLAGYLRETNPRHFRVPLYGSRLALERVQLIEKLERGEETGPLPCPVCSPRPPKAKKKST